MEFLKDNWVNILAIVGALDGLFYAVTKITKTTADDNVYTIIHNFIVKFFPQKQQEAALFIKACYSMYKKGRASPVA